MTYLYAQCTYLCFIYMLTELKGVKNLELRYIMQIQGWTRNLTQAVAVLIVIASMEYTCNKLHFETRITYTE